MKIYETIEQGSDEWHNVRAGKITGSILPHLITSKTLKISDSEAATKELCKIIATKYAITEDFFETDDIRRGYTGEAEAKVLYKRKTFQPIKEVGFIESDCGKYGMSPDGIVDDGFIEIKAPRQGNYVYDAISDQKIYYYKYRLQIIMGFVVNENFKWCDFITCNTNLQEGKQFIIKRITRESETEAIDIVKKHLTILIDRLQTMEEKFLNNFN